MIAIVSIGGQQFKISEGQEIFVNKLAANEGDAVTFEEVLLLDNNGDVSIGTPHLSASVNAKVLEHVKADKKIIFKKKRRKGYKLKRGHRQPMTKIQIESISA